MSRELPTPQRNTAEQTAPAQGRAVDAVWPMLQALPPRGREEIAHWLALELRPPRSPLQLRREELGPLAALLNQHGRPVHGSPASPSTAAGPPVEPTDRPRHRLNVPKGREVAGRRPGSPLPQRTWLTIERHRYDRQRPPDSPPSQQLVARYGPWIDVCRAADGLLPDGRYLGLGRPWRCPTYDDQGRQGPGQPMYDKAACRRAIERCATALGRQPSTTDYIRWRAGRLSAAPRSDRLALGLPTYNVIKERFGGWKKATSQR